MAARCFAGLVERKTAESFCSRLSPRANERTQKRFKSDITAGWCSFKVVHSIKNFSYPLMHLKAFLSVALTKACKLLIQQ